MKPRTKMTSDELREEFRIHVDWDDAKPDKCWLWRGPRPSGKRGRRYGRFNVGAKSWPAHRFAYEDLVGEVPEDREVPFRGRLSHSGPPESGDLNLAWYAGSPGLRPAV